MGRGEKGEREREDSFKLKGKLDHSALDQKPNKSSLSKLKAFLLEK
jgi:hypothetical protein